MHVVHWDIVSYIDEDEKCLVLPGDFVLGQAVSPLIASVTS